MIVYRMKMQGGKIMWDARPVKQRRVDPKARRNVRRFRRIWWWEETRWKQRHGENSNPVQTDM